MKRSPGEHHSHHFPVDTPQYLQDGNYQTSLVSVRTRHSQTCKMRYFVLFYFPLSRVHGDPAMELLVPD